MKGNIIIFNISFSKIYICCCATIQDVERFLRAMYYAAASGDGDRPRNSRRSLELNPWG